MTGFDDASTLRPTGGSTFAWDVPDGWQQGRGAWGGLVVGALVGAVCAVDPSPVRSVSVQMSAPATVGPHVVAIAPGSHSITVPVQIMIDPLNAQWVWQSHVTRHPLTGEITAFGNTSISVHGKSATLRFASALASWDGHGQNGPHGSAVGVRWNVVAPPPLPRSDQQLLPWD